MIDRFKSKYDILPIHVKASIWFLFSSFLQKGISVITTPIFTRIMSSSEYGEFSIFNSWLSLATVFISLNLSSGVYTQGLIKCNDKVEQDSFSSSLHGLTITLIIIWLFIYIVFNKAINKILSLSTTNILLMFVIIWTNAIFNFWASNQRVKLKYKKLVTVVLLYSIIQPLISIIVVKIAKDKVTGRIISIAIVQFVVYIALFIKQMKEGKIYFSKNIWIYALSFNIPLVPHYISQSVLNSADRIMIGSIIGKSESGIYSLAYSVASIMLLFNSSLLQTIDPWIYQKIKQKKIEEISKVGYLSLGIVAIANLLLILIAPEIVLIFAPKEYYNSIWIVPSIAMSNFFMFSYSLFAGFEFYYKKTLFIMIASVIGAIVNIILNYIFIPKFGYIAAGYTTLVCYIIYAIGHYSFMNEICKKNKHEKIYSNKILIRLSLGFLIFGFLIMSTYKYNILRYILAISILIISFMNKKKVIELINILKKDKRK